MYFMLRSKRIIILLFTFEVKHSIQKLGYPMFSGKLRICNDVQIHSLLCYLQCGIFQLENVIQNLSSVTNFFFISVETERSFSDYYFFFSVFLAQMCEITCMYIPSTGS